MTTTPTIANPPVRLDFERTAATFAKAMVHLDSAATTELDRAGIDPRLRELLRLRVSQLNGCAYCVDMHSKNARALGESEQRLFALPVWSETPFFAEPEPERAALAFAEAIVAMADSHVPTETYEAAARYYEPAQIAALVALVVTITAWNAIGVSSRLATRVPPTLTRTCGGPVLRLRPAGLTQVVVPSSARSTSQSVSVFNRWWRPHKA